MSGMAVAVGFASATTNPFTIGIAQTFGQSPMFSGLSYRWIIFVVFYLVAVALVMRYALKIKKDPTKSLVYGLDYSAFNVETGDNIVFTGKHKILMLGMVATVGTIVYGSLKLGWYINEMSAVFIISGILSAIVGGKGPEGICKDLITSLSEMTTAMVVVGLSPSDFSHYEERRYYRYCNPCNERYDGRTSCMGYSGNDVSCTEFPELLYPVGKRSGGGNYADYDTAGRFI